MLSPRARRVPILLVVVLVALAAAAASAVLREDAARGADRGSLDEARALIVAVDHAQLCHRAQHDRYTSSLADLQLAAATKQDGVDVSGDILHRMTEGHFDLTVDAGTTGRSYVVRVQGDDVDTALERWGTDFVDYGDMPDGLLAERC